MECVKLTNLASYNLAFTLNTYFNLLFSFTFFCLLISYLKGKKLLTKKKDDQNVLLILRRCSYERNVGFERVNGSKKCLSAWIFSFNECIILIIAPERSHLCGSYISWSIDLQLLCLIYTELKILAINSMSQILINTSFIILWRTLVKGICRCNFQGS